MVLDPNQMRKYCHVVHACACFEAEVKSSSVVPLTCFWEGDTAQQEVRWEEVKHRGGELGVDMILIWSISILFWYYHIFYSYSKSLSKGFIWTESGRLCICQTQFIIYYSPIYVYIVSRSIAIGGVLLYWTHFPPKYSHSVLNESLKNKKLMNWLANQLGIYLEWTTILLIFKVLYWN